MKNYDEMTQEELLKYNNEDEWARFGVIYFINFNLLTQKELLEHVKNENEWVRWEIAKRIDPIYLPQMMNDEDYRVKQTVACRIDPSYLPQMIGDENHFVKCAVVERADLTFLLQIMHSVDWSLRRTIAKRVGVKYLPQMIYTKKDIIEDVKKNYYRGYKGLVLEMIKQIREIVFKRIPRELVPKKFLKAFDKFHVNKVLES